MKIPFYQTEWLGVDLIKLAANINHDRSQIAGTKFYNAIYHNLFNNKGFLLSPAWAWVQKKHNLSAWLHLFLNTIMSANPAILSVGCGFGIVELPLIQKGMNINLQECQNYSIEYLKKNYPEVFKKTSFIISEDLSDIPSNSYDVVMSITSSYCLNQETLLSFLKAVKRILKKGGVFIWYETVLSFEDIGYFIKSTFYNIIFRHKNYQDKVLWGWKRSMNHQSLRARSQGLKLCQTFYFDKNNLEVFPSKFLGLPYGNALSWQAGIYMAL